MKFQIILAAIFAFAAVSAKKSWGQENIQQANIKNCAQSNGNALAINSAFVGDANAFVHSSATNINCVDQDQRNY